MPTLKVAGAPAAKLPFCTTVKVEPFSMNRLPRLCVTAAAPGVAAPRVTTALLSCSTLFPSSKAESLVMARLPPLSRTRPVPKA